MSRLSRTLVPLGACASLLLASACDTTPMEDDDTDPPDDDTTPTHEEGCITIDGQTPGYASLADALAAAPEGAELAVCDGAYEGAFVLDHPVKLVGGGATVLVGPPNEIPLTITGTDVVVQNLSVQSSRTAVDVQEGARATLRGVEIDGAGQIGVVTTAATVTLDDVTITDSAYGGAEFTLGSTATVMASRFDGNANFGIHVQSSGLTLNDTTIDGTQPIEVSGGEYDGGDAIFVDVGDGPIVIDNLQAHANARVGIFAQTATIEVRNSLVSGGSYGVFAAGGGASVVEDSQFTGLALVGLNFIDQQADILRNTIALAPETSYVGIAVGKDGLQAEISGNTVTGSGITGIRVQSAINGSEFYGFSGGSAVMADNSVSDASILGIYAASLDSLDYQRNVVTGLAWVGELSPAGAYDTGFGHLLVDIQDGDGALHMEGNEAHDCDVAGIFLAETRFESSGSLISGNSFLGMLYQDSAGIETGSYFDDNNITAVQVEGSSVEFEGCSFSRNIPGEPPEAWGDPDTILYSATGLLVYEGTARVTEGVFADNDGTGLYSYESDTTLLTSSFTSNGGVGLFAQGLSSEGHPLRVEGCTFTDNTTYHLSTNYSDAEFVDNVFQGVTGWLSAYGYDFTGTFEGNTFTGANTYHLYLYSSGTAVGDPTIVDNHFSEMTTYAINGSNLTGLVADNDFVGGYAGFYGYLQGMDETRALTLGGNKFSDASYGVQLQVSTIVGSGPVVTVAENDFSSLTGSALSVTAVGGALILDGNIVRDVAGDAVAVNNGPGSTLMFSASGNDIQGALGDGMSLQYTSVVVADNVALSGCGADGLRLGPGVTGEVVGNSLTSNTGYGIGCYDPTVALTACENFMGSNTLGDVGLLGGCAVDCTVQPAS